MNKTGSLLLLPVLVALLLLSTPWKAAGRPEFARFTGNPCSACHISPQGGGPLTPTGEAFKRKLADLDITMDPNLRISSTQRLLNVVLYFLHIPFGVAWVGLFLYTFAPSVRKKAPAVLPKSYVRQMIYGAVVVLVTGPMMVAFRMKMVPDLFRTRFGLLLLIKITAVLVLLASTVSLLWYGTVVLARRYRRLAKAMGKGSVLELTPEDLELFSGRDKRKALIAVGGRLYDVTGRDLWRRGIHPGGHRAGGDLTADLAKAPHGREVFDRITQVGELNEPAAAKRKRPLSWAVMSGLTASVIILMVVALWRL